MTTHGILVHFCNDLACLLLVFLLVLLVTGYVWWCWLVSVVGGAQENYYHIFPQFGYHRLSAVIVEANSGMFCPFFLNSGII